MKAFGAEFVVGRRAEGGVADELVSLGACEKHPFDGAAGTCRRCKRSWCPDCLVYSFGPRKAPFCVDCALVAAGIRRYPNS